VSDGFSAPSGGFAAGSRIAGYQLEQEIGRGGMAVVFRARDERLGRLVALKILAPALAGDEAFRQRFISESRAAAAIDDPHIVPVYEAGESDGVLFIAMRFVPGGDAQSRLRQDGPMSPGRAAEVISPVASALDAAHAAGLLHRDVKPSNMLVDSLPGRPDHVYLSDFGLSKAVAAAGMTQTGHIVGTLDYISPEQIEGRPVDGRCDQYALACSAFELLTGTPPFRRDEPTAVLYAQMSEPPPALTSRRPDLPPAVDAVLARALAKAPDSRYPGCREFADALRVALGFRPYDSGPQTAPILHPPTEVARPSASPTPPMPVAPPPAWTPPMSDLPTSAGQPGYPPLPSGYPPAALGAPARPARRRTALILTAVAAAIVLIAAGLTFALAGRGPRPATVAIRATSALHPVTGYVYVIYHSGSQAHAEISGRVRGAAPGEIVRLYARPFPFRRAPAAVGVARLKPAGPGARYEFPVTPVLATRYTAEVFASATATTPVGTSPVTTVYVAVGGSSGNSPACTRPVCHLAVTTTNFVPPAALGTEMAKPWYAYFAVTLSTTKQPPAPAVLALGAGHPVISAPRQVAPNEYTENITFTFTVGNDGYTWGWSACARDTEPIDGVGLPGSHGCGASQAPDSAAYLG
jgi:serine/threonine protein kinase